MLTPNCLRSIAKLRPSATAPTGRSAAASAVQMRIAGLRDDQPVAFSPNPIGLGHLTESK
jgi:hypothetical protein